MTTDKKLEEIREKHNEDLVSKSRLYRTEDIAFLLSHIETLQQREEKLSDANAGMEVDRRRLNSSYASLKRVREALEKQRGARKALSLESFSSTAEPNMVRMRAEYFCACRETENALARHEREWPKEPGKK